MTRIAIIGAGLSGLVAARRLNDAADVTVFEKSRGAGGRMATRYAGDFEFDHGAQFFTARSSAFRKFLQPLLADGVVAHWPALFAELDREGVTATRAWGDDYPHFVGTPRMNRVGKYLSADLDVRYETEVAAIARNNDQWILFDTTNTELGRFEWLVLSAPAPQTEVLAREFPEVVSLCREKTMHGCFALMLGFAQPLELPWQAALVRRADISWVSVNSSKPGRNDAYTLVIHSTNTWADAHIDDDMDSALEHLLNEASLVTGEDLHSAAHRQAHRWRYANIDKQTGPASLINDDKQLAVSGDWLVRGSVEAAFTSANDLGRKLRERL